MSIKDQETTRYAYGDHQTPEKHHTWIEANRFLWCQPCYEQTGIRRMLGVGSLPVPVVRNDRIVWEAAVPTCPVCLATQRTPVASRLDPPDPHDWADRVAP